MIYQREGRVPVPNVDLLTFLFDHPDTNGDESTPVHAEAHDTNYVITRGQARSLTRQFAHFLREEYGIGSAGPDRHVVVCVANGQCALPCVFWAVIAAEGIYSAASAAATPADIARQIGDGPGKLLICTDDLRELGIASAKIAGLSERNVLLLRSYPSVQLCSASGEVACEFKQELEWPTITDPKELENRTICILYSSGTTGLPKGVRISHTNMVAEAVLPSSQNRPVFEKWRQQGRGFESRTLGHLPTAHIAGAQGYFVTPMHEGTCVYWMAKFNFVDFLRYCQTCKITYFFSVPPIYMAISKSPAVQDQLSHIRYAIAGAAPLSGETQDAANQKMPRDASLSQLWGLSETTGAITHTPPDQSSTSGSVGFLLPNIMMRLVDDEGNDVEPGEPGESWIKGPVVTKGYHNNPEANKIAFSADGWFKSGDILRVENDQFFVVDRKKELIKYKGLQVAPAELEGILIAHPAVLDAAVLGIQADGNELPRAFVVLASPAKGKLSEADLIEYVKKQVSSHKQLRGGLVFVELVPRSPSGKILRRHLRDLYDKEQKASRL